MRIIFRIVLNEAGVLCSDRQMVGKHLGGVSVWTFEVEYDKEEKGEG